MPRTPSAEPAEQHPGVAVPRELCELVDDGDDQAEQPVDLLIDREDRQALIGRSHLGNGQQSGSSPDGQYSRMRHRSS
jgi:hypothetical protein